MTPTFLGLNSLEKRQEINNYSDGEPTRSF
jgi:hypothetical protein